MQPVVTAVPVKSPATTSVVVESSRFDMSQMKMEDFTSQRLQDDFDVSTAKQDDIASTSSSPTPSQKSPARSEGRKLIQGSILHFLTYKTKRPARLIIHRGLQGNPQFSHSKLNE